MTRARSRAINGFDIVLQRPRSIARNKIIEVVERDSPLIVSIPHSGTWIPQEALSHIEHSRLLQLDTDLFTHLVYAGVAELGSSVRTNVNPYVVNVNRGWTKPELPIIPTHLMSGQATLLRPYTQAQRTRLLSTYYNSYHAQLIRLQQRALRRFGFCLHLDGHGMNRSGVSHTKDPGEQRNDMAVGDDNGKSADEAIVSAIELYLVKAGYHAVRNKPYSGGHTTRVYGNPAKRLHVVQIELVKQLYMDQMATPFEASKKPHLKKQALARLQKALREALAAGLRAAAVAR